MQVHEPILDVFAGKPYLQAMFRSLERKRKRRKEHAMMAANVRWKEGDKRIR